jgi:acyl-coenzyme A thioesterase PaaI-like protein
MSGDAQAVGRLKGLVTNASGLRRMMNLWPPFLFAGIHVQRISPDFREVLVRLRHTMFTSNYVGTQFGGSLFAMTDPFWMIMVMRNLGRDYVVWDVAGEIRFLRASTQAVTAHFRLEESVLVELRDAATDGAKVLRWFEVDVVDADGIVVAQVRKQLYVRRARSAPQDAAGPVDPPIMGS